MSKILYYNLHSIKIRCKTNLNTHMKTLSKMFSKIVQSNHKISQEKIYNLNNLKRKLVFTPSVRSVLIFRKNIRPRYFRKS